MELYLLYFKKDPSNLAFYIYNIAYIIMDGNKEM